MEASREGEIYLLRYIGAPEPIRLTKKTRDNVLNLMADGKKFVQIGPFTIMVNSIVAIEPEWY